VQYQHGLLIGPYTAKRVKEEIATLRENLPDEKYTLVNGRDLLSGLPRQIVLKQSEVREVLKPAFATISNVVLKVLQQTPPELSSDIIEGGILVNGGCALIDGVDEFFQKQIGLNVYVSKDPLTAIVEGTKVLLKNRGNYFIKPIE